MTKAGVNTVALAIFSWDRIQPAPRDTWDFDWLDRIIGKLGKAGIAVDLASATAAAPLWLYRAHPEVLPVEANGNVVHAGSRQSWRPTSPVFREYALTLCRKLARTVQGQPLRDRLAHGATNTAGTTRWTIPTTPYARSNAGARSATARRRR